MTWQDEETVGTPIIYLWSEACRERNTVFFNELPNLEVMSMSSDEQKNKKNLQNNQK